MSNRRALITEEPLAAVKVSRGDYGIPAGPIVRIPRSSAILVLGDSRLEGMVEFDWQGEAYAAFAVDLFERCRAEQSDEPSGLRHVSAG